jgi:hypothetical protein
MQYGIQHYTACEGQPVCAMYVFSTTGALPQGTPAGSIR